MVWQLTTPHSLFPTECVNISYNGLKSNEERSPSFPPGKWVVSRFKLKIDYQFTMKVKSIKQLRKWFVEDESVFSTYKQDGSELPSTVNPNFIGCDYEGKLVSKKTFGFFAAYHGQKSNVANFLSTGLQNAEDGQAIYEFIQNAADCESNAFYIFYNEKYFMALNNGTQFKRDEIVSILNTSQSSKSDDSNQGIDCDKIGRFGIGFKLVHRLVGKNEGLTELTEDYKGPILFSWSQREQLEALLETKNAHQIDYENDLTAEAPWLFKIVITNFPTEPGETIKDLKYENLTAFTEEEFEELLAFIKENEAKLDLNQLQQGSLFFLKLGEDKNKSLDKNSDNLKKGVECSLNLLKSLKTVVFNERAIQKLSLEMIKFTVNKDSEEFNEINPTDKKCDIKIVLGYLPYSRSQEIKQYPNFYKFFPMGAEEHGLSFIIHCDAFKIETNRRELEEVPTNKAIFRWFSDRFCETLESDWQNKPNSFRERYANILLSDEPKKPWLVESLYEPLLHYIQSKIPTQQGNFYAKDRVCIKDTALEVIPSDFGIKDIEWFYWKDINPDKELVRQAKNKLELKVWKIDDLIVAGDPEVINRWIANLKNEPYQLFFKELDRILILKNKSYNELINSLCNLKLFKFTNGQYYSINELKQKQDYLLVCSEDVLKLKSILTEKLEFCVSNFSLSDYNNLLEGLQSKLEEHLGTKVFEKLSEKTSNLDCNSRLKLQDKNDLFVFLKSIKGIGEETLKKLILYKDYLDKPKALGQLLSQKLSLPDWLKPYKIHQKEYFSELEEYLLPEKQIYNLLIYPNWSQIIAEIETELNKSNMARFYEEVIEFFKSSENKSPLTEYSYIFTSEGFQPIDKVFYSEHLTATQSYNHLQSALQEITNLNLPEQNVVQYLSKRPFKTDRNKLEEKISTESVELEVDEIENLIQFTALNDESFFNIFYISRTHKPDIYVVNYNRNKDVAQYYATKPNLREYIEKNLVNRLKLLPEEFYNEAADNKQGLLTEQELYPKLLDEYFSDEFVEDLITVVKESGIKEVEQEFLRRIPRVTLIENQEYNKDSYEYQILELACQRLGDDDDLRVQFRDKLKIVDTENTAYPVTEAVKDEIIFDIYDQKYELILSEVLPRYRGTTRVISKVLKQFEGLTSELEKLLEIGELTVEKVEVYEELKQDYNPLENAQQLAFVVLYAKSDRDVNLLKEFSIYVKQ